MEILGDLAARVRIMVETEPLLEMVASRVAEALHVPRIAILRDGNGAARWLISGLWGCSQRHFR